MVIRSAFLEKLLIPLEKMGSILGMDSGNHEGKIGLNLPRLVTEEPILLIGPEAFSCSKVPSEASNTCEAKSLSKKSFGEIFWINILFGQDRKASRVVGVILGRDGALEE
jgi:hypothetical protein